MSKPKYEIGDYVRIKNDLKVDYDKGLVPEMVDMAGQIVQISRVNSDDTNDIDDLIYVVKELKNYWWSEDWFEYRLGNYEDNDFSSGEVFYTVGFKHMGSVHTFIGKLQKWSTDKCEFINKNGIILMVDYNNLEYVIPKENA